MAAEFSFEEAQSPQEFTFEDAQKAPEFSFETAQKELAAQPKEASWYETISSLPERVVQGARAILPNYNNMVAQEELARRKFPAKPKSLSEQINETLKLTTLPNALFRLPDAADNIVKEMEPTDELEARSRGIADTAAEANKRLAAARPQGEDTAQQVVGGAFETLGPGLGAVGVIAASRGAALPKVVSQIGAIGGMGLAVGGGYAGEAGGTFQEAIERGATVREAAESGRFAGDVSGPLSAIAPALAGRAGISLPRRIAEAMGANAGEEFVTAFSSGVQQKMAWDPNRGFDEIVRDSLLEAAGGLIGGAVMGPVGKVGDIVGGGKSREQLEALRDIAREIENGTILTGVPPAMAPHLEQYGAMLAPETAEIAAGAPSGAAVLIPGWQFSSGLVDLADMAKRWELATDNMDSDRADQLIDQFEQELSSLNGQGAIDMMAQSPEDLAAAVLMSGRNPLAPLEQMLAEGRIGEVYYQNFVDAYNETIETAKTDLNLFLMAQPTAADARRRLEELANEDVSMLIDDSEELTKEIENVKAMMKGQALPHSASLPFTKVAITAAKKDIAKLQTLLYYLEGRRTGKLLPERNSYGWPIDYQMPPGFGGIPKSSLPAGPASVTSADGQTINVTDVEPDALQAGSVATIYTTNQQLNKLLDLAREYVLNANKYYGLNVPLIITGMSHPSRYAQMLTADSSSRMDISDSLLTASKADQIATIAHEYAHHVAGQLIAMDTTAYRALQKAWQKMVFEYLRDPNKTTREYEEAARGTENRWNSLIFADIGNALFNPSKTSAVNYVASFVEWLAHQGERSVRAYPELSTPGIKAIMDRVRSSVSDVRSLLPSEAYQVFNEMRSNKLDAALMEANKQAMYTIGAHLLVRSPSSPMTTIIMERAIADDAGIPADEINTHANPSPNLSTSLSKPLKSAINWAAPKGTSKVNMTAGATAIGLDLDKFNKFGSKWQGILQLTWKNPHIAALRTYTEAVMEFANTRAKWMTRANDTVKAMHKLGSQRIEQLTNFMLEETDRERAFDMADPVDQAYVKQTYPLLNAKAFEVYQQVRSDFIDFLRSVGQAGEAAIRRRVANDPVKQAAEVIALRQKIANQLAKPYFPMARFGNYMVYLKAESDFQFEGKQFKAGGIAGVFAFETEREQKRFAADLARRYPQQSITARMTTEMERSLVGMNPVLVEAMMANLGLNQQQQNEMQEFLLKISPAMSWTKHLISRKKTLGYSRDGTRAFADYFMHGSNHLARMMHADSMREALKQMEIEELSAQGRPGNPVDSTKRSMIRQWAMDHFDYVLNPREEWAKARAVVAIAYLGGSLRSALINLTQTANFTFPYLAAKHGDIKAIAAITRQFKSAPRLYKMISGMTQSEELILQKYMQGNQLTPNEERTLAKRLGATMTDAKSVKKAVGLMKGLQLAVQQGFLDESNATELAAMSEGGWMYRSRASSQMSYYGRSLLHALMYPFQEAEKLNRRVAFSAAYELAYEQTGDEAQAFEAAKEAVFRTQFEYSKWNRAPALRGRKGLALMFWQYQLSALSQLVSDPKFFWRAALVQVMLAGSLGLPFAENILDLIDWLLERINPNKRGDTRYEAQKILEEHMGFWGADIALHGLSPLSGVDISGSMSMGRFLPLTDTLFGSQGLMHGVVNLLPGENVPVLPFKDLVQRSAEDAGGAAIALAFRLLKGLTSNDPNTVANALRSNPISFLRDATEAMHMAFEGEAKSVNGVPVVEFDLDDPRHSAELIARGFGFQPTSIRTGRRDSHGELVEGSPGRDLNWLIQRQTMYYQTRRQMLISGFTFAYLNGDEEAQEIVHGQINAFNEEVGRFGLGIKRETIRQSIKRKAEAEALAREGLRPGSRLHLAEALREREF